MHTFFCDQENKIFSAHKYQIISSHNEVGKFCKNPLLIYSFLYVVLLCVVCVVGRDDEEEVGPTPGEPLHHHDRERLLLQQPPGDPAVRPEGPAPHARVHP